MFEIPFPLGDLQRSALQHDMLRIRQTTASTLL